MSTFLDAVGGNGKGKATTEIVEGGRVIWQADNRMKVYRCPVCQRPIFSQYIGDVAPVIFCEGGRHRLQWELLL